MSDKKAPGIIILGLGQILISLLGGFFLISALKDIFDINTIQRNLIDLTLIRAREAGLNKIYFFWPVLYISMGPLGIGMLLRRKWAHFLSQIFIPLVILSSFPFIFVDCRVKLSTLQIAYSFSEILETQSEFLPLFFKVTTPWYTFITLGFTANYFLRKYLNSQEIKNRFS
tara:strand:+ start:30 stop:542 length:513 start_codon:yes stop_codon:yes gene_type:complete